MPLILLNFLIKLPKSIFDQLNKSLVTMDISNIEYAYEKTKRSMFVRYVIFLTISLLLHMLSWYYVTVFCGVYVSSSISWVCGGILTAIIKICFTQVLMPLIHAVVRLIAQKFPNKL